MTGSKITCPRCRGGIPNDKHEGEYPGALSRVDNQTEICSSCGVNEAMFNLEFPGKELPRLTRPVYD